MWVRSQLVFIARRHVAHVDQIDVGEQVSSENLTQAVNPARLCAHGHGAKSLAF